MVKRRLKRCWSKRAKIYPKNDVGCIDDTSEVKENMVADNSQMKKENMEARNNYQVKLVATNGGQKESLIDKSMVRE